MVKRGKINWEVVNKLLDEGVNIGSLEKDENGKCLYLFEFIPLRESSMTIEELMDKIGVKTIM